MNARSALRAATASQHDRVDRLFGCFDFSSPEGYADFLGAQAAPFLAVEAELERREIHKILPDWEQRRRGPSLIADLNELGLRPDPCASPELPDHPAQMGAAYVLEGSRLGAKVIGSRIPRGVPRRFLCHVGAPGGWRKLMERLDEVLYGPERIGAACVAAEQIFELFETAGRRKQEAVSA